jgi:hypothetical protein
MFTDAEDSYPIVVFTNYFINTFFSRHSNRPDLTLILGRNQTIALALQ